MDHDLDSVVCHDLFAPVTKFRVAFTDPALRDTFNAGLEEGCRSGTCGDLLEKCRMQADQSIGEQPTGGNLEDARQFIPSRMTPEAIP